jgi:mRNA interferase RelE/StbE
VAGDRYQIRLTPTATRELAGLQVAAQRRLGRVIDELANEPRPNGSRLLAGRRDERIWRIRVGDYRILYEIRDAVLLVLVIRIGHRREIYRRPRSRG